MRYLFTPNILLATIRIKIRRFRIVPKCPRIFARECTRVGSSRRFQLDRSGTCVTNRRIVRDRSSTGVVRATRAVKHRERNRRHRARCRAYNSRVLVAIRAASTRNKQLVFWYVSVESISQPSVCYPARAPSARFADDRGRRANLRGHEWATIAWEEQSLLRNRPGLLFPLSVQISLQSATRVSRMCALIREPHG